MEKYFLAAMGCARGLGNKSIARLVKFFGSAKTAWSVDFDDLVKCEGVNKKALGAFVFLISMHPNLPEKLADYCERQKIKICSIFEDDYPAMLREIDSPPMTFYYRGQLQSHAQRLAVIGSRKNTPYGESVASGFGEEIAAAGLTVVSGAAKGIDTFAHCGALKSGRTVAVLGSGLDIPFPKENAKLLDAIAERGVVMSEYHPQTPPNRGNFPARNRIIAGLSKGVVVVEAAKKSGSIIASNLALKYKRNLFAVPGSEGCNELIINGAAVDVKSARDVFKLAPVSKNA